MAVVFWQGDIDPVRLCLVYRRSDPEPQTYLHLRGWVGVLLRLLIYPEALILGSWGGCLPPTGVLPMTGGGALRVEDGVGLEV